MMLCYAPYLYCTCRAAREEDVEIRVLLITSPHNPTGRLYSAKALLGAVAWARKRGLHVIVDEVLVVDWLVG